MKGGITFSVGGGRKVMGHLHYDDKRCSDCQDLLDMQCVNGLPRMVHCNYIRGY